jgi:hypothetical protein
MPNSDRTVHASYPGMEIVRYDRAGKWYLEPTERRLIACQKVSVGDAARAAMYGLANGGEVYFGRPGGKLFDAKVRGQ